MTLSGKVAFITGAGSGIGQGTAVRLAREGADVCIAEIDLDAAAQTASMVREFGRQAMVTQCNVVSKPQVQAATQACVERFGRLDVAVANAGVGRAASILDMELKAWQDQLDINLTGVFLTVQAAAQQMVKLGNGGRIVCISSLAALNVGPMMWSYSATKAGVQIMVRGWAQELGPHGITVNAIGPGVIDTPLTAQIKNNEAWYSAYADKSIMKRWGRPEEVAAATLFLCSDAASYITGTILFVDGGWTAHDGRFTPPGM